MSSESGVYGNGLPRDGSGNIINPATSDNQTNGNQIAQVVYKDSANLDAFGRLRSGSPFGLFDNKNTLSHNPDQWQELTNGAGASISHNSDRASVSLTVGTADGEYAIRQTNLYFAYVPGKSQLILQTFVFEDAKTNLTQRVGYFDDNDGLFLEQADSTIRFVRRTSTSGSAVDNQIDQADWNIDKLDGTGASGITLDLTKTQILVIDFQWLGVGRIRYGFDIGGQVVYCHEVNNANSLDVVYMKRPSLPLRYEIRNTGVTASSSTLEEICCSVSSEGGYQLPGLEFIASRGTSLISLGDTSRTPILAIRLKNTFNSLENRRTIRLLSYSAYATAQNVYLEIAHLHSPSAITATWTDIGTGSAVEYSTDISAVTGNPEHIIDDLYVISGQAGKGTSSTGTLEFVNEHSFISQDYDSNNSQMFVFYATAFSANANVSCSFKFIEFE